MNADYNAIMPAYHVENFGCRATQADGAAIERELLWRGLSPAGGPERADVVVFNTCTVTAAADADARAAIRRVHRDNPDCKIMVTGCYAQRAPGEIAALPGVTWVVGNSHKPRVAGIASEGVQSTANANFVPLHQIALDHHPRSPSFQLVDDIFAHTELMAAPVFDFSSDSAGSASRTRPNLKVQDGCNNRCSFCVIPFVRGQSRSLALEEVLREVNALVSAGFREIVLSGINLGRWGRDFASSQRFEDLLKTILKSTDIERLRISSVEPMDWSDELIELVTSSPRICKHAHVPLQSGSDQVLRLMHRKYRPWHYADRIRKIRTSMPNAAIGADVMVGFPGETDQLFEESRRFIEDLSFTYLHVFTYSSRPGTAAAAMADHVPVQLARERNEILRNLIGEKNRVFRASFVGQQIEAITLRRRGEGFTDALTNNFIKLQLMGLHEPNLLLKTSITGVTPDGLTGTLLN